MAWTYCLHFRNLVGARFEHGRASWMERASRRRVDRRRHLSCEHDLFPLYTRTRGQGGRYERPRVGVVRVPEERLRICLFDDLTEVHNPDAMAHIPDGCQLVGDEQIEAQAFLRLCSI